MTSEMGGIASQRGIFVTSDLDLAVRRANGENSQLSNEQNKHIVCLFGEDQFIVLPETDKRIQEGVFLPLTREVFQAREVVVEKKELVDRYFDCNPVTVEMPFKGLSEYVESYSGRTEDPLTPRSISRTESSESESGDPIQLSAAMQSQLRAEMLATMSATGQLVAKASRQKHKFLDRSFLLTREGDVYELFHQTTKGLPKRPIDGLTKKKKHFLGEGGYKKVYKVEKIEPQQAPEMVRAVRYKPRKQPEDGAVLCVKDSPEKAKEISELCHGVPHVNFGRYYETEKGGIKKEKWLVEFVQTDLADAIMNEVPYLAMLKGALGGAKGLEALHAMGIVHRDVKPDNIGCNWKEGMKMDNVDGSIIDPDFCIIEPSNDQFIGGVGTPAYLPREVFTGDCKGLEGGKKFDVYSFGVVLWVIENEALPSFLDVNRLELNQVQTQEYFDEAGGFDGNSIKSDRDSLEKLVWDCTQVVPEKRPSMAEVTKRLENILSNLHGVGEGDYWRYQVDPVS